MTESNPATSQGRLLDTQDEEDPYHAPIPRPTQEDHLPMAFRPIYHFDAHKQSWIMQMPTTLPSDASRLTQFKLITWNIDFMQSYGEERYIAALNFLERFLTQDESPGSTRLVSSTVILLQEIDQRLLEYITGHPFVRESYLTTDISGNTWLNDDNVYGVVTLIPKTYSGNVASVFRTNFPGSRMGREALYVDLVLPNPEELIPSTEGDTVAFDHEREGESQQLRYLRIANVHLESLRGRSDAERLEQLSSTVPFLTAPGVHVGVVAGDMNPIGPEDAGLPLKLGLIDAWIAYTRRKREREGCTISDEEIDDDPLGYTWGYQPPTTFSPRRMDKVLMCGNVDVVDIERIADGLEVQVVDETEMQVLWVTDHCGLFASLVVE
ncbi:hypothetical protein CVT24_003579 [Panaeolus cyanescens]|uniref:Endonuclease/exonuclease/phosphatase domain-containing protein n=1 Tax=Panaeolus cyanescens TaxID=181874 RepID=A0A409Y7P4_9AGAR|nr:hypothetical protein CVT24_003579 [Panaeolus cyanescens]